MLLSSAAHFLSLPIDFICHGVSLICAIYKIWFHLRHDIVENMSCITPICFQMGLLWQKSLLEKQCSIDIKPSYNAFLVILILQDGSFAIILGEEINKLHLHCFKFGHSWDVHGESIFVVTILLLIRQSSIINDD